MTFDNAFSDINLNAGSEAEEEKAAESHDRLEELRERILSREFNSAADRKKMEQRIARGRRVMEKRPEIEDQLKSLRVGDRPAEDESRAIYAFNLVHALEGSPHRLMETPKDDASNDSGNDNDPNNNGPDTPKP